MSLFYAFVEISTPEVSDLIIDTGDLVLDTVVNGLVGLLVHRFFCSAVYYACVVLYYLVCCSTMGLLLYSCCNTMKL